jgi:predicted metal-binding membrane protein
VVVVSLVAFAVAGWMYLGVVTTQMGDMSSALAMPMTSAWSSGQVTLIALMWAVMMAAMMLPSAVPMVLTYDRMDRGLTNERDGSTTLFVVGYVLVWSAFAVMATALQWVLHDLALLNSMGALTQSGLAGLFLIGSGIFQFSPVKRRSLGACRTPIGFLLTSWRDGGVGALRMGLHHGTLCVRCCWALMLLLFILGVMNLLWVAVLALFVLAEKVSRRGEVVSQVGGVVMIVWGIGVVLGVG